MDLKTQIANDLDTIISVNPVDVQFEDCTLTGIKTMLTRDNVQDSDFYVKNYAFSVNLNLTKLKKIPKADSLVAIDGEDYLVAKCETDQMGIRLKLHLSTRYRR